MALRDPALIVSLRAACNRRSIAAGNCDLFRGVDTLYAAGGATSALTAFAGNALLLAEEGCEPGVVDEVGGACEEGGEDQVEEDAV